MLLSGHGRQNAVRHNSTGLTKVVHADIMPIRFSIHEILSSSVHWTPPTLLKQGVARIHSHMDSQRKAFEIKLRSSKLTIIETDESRLEDWEMAKHEKRTKRKT